MIEITSAAQFEASQSATSQLATSTDGALPPLERITDDTWAIALPLPPSGSSTVPYTLCYLLLDAAGDVHLVDPGFGSEQNQRLVLSALADLGRSRVASVISTHLHPDHLGLAEWARREFGARIVLHEREQQALDVVTSQVDELAGLAERWGVPAGEMPQVPDRLHRGFQPLGEPADVLVADDELLDIPGRDIRVLFTPGHTPGHVCLRDETQGLVFTGDHVLPTVYPGLGLGGPSEHSPIGDYLASLDRIRVHDGDEVLPGHGYRFLGLEERVATIEAHHRKRSAEAAAVLEASPQASVWDVASRVQWTAGWQNLQGFLRFSALAQTEMHVRYLRGD